jgi:hypothetical protein
MEAEFTQIDRLFSFYFVLAHELKESSQSKHPLRERQKFCKLKIFVPKHVFQSCFAGFG